MVAKEYATVGTKAYDNFVNAIRSPKVSKATSQCKNEMKRDHNEKRKVNGQYGEAKEIAPRSI